MEQNIKLGYVSPEAEALEINLDSAVLTTSGSGEGMDPGSGSWG